MSVVESDSGKAVLPYGRLPLLFARNAGQFKGNALYRAQDSVFGCVFEKDRILLTFFGTGSEEVEGERIVEGVTLALRFVDPGEACKVEGYSPEEGKFNYFRGNDPRGHIVNVDLYRGAAYRELWPGIDVVVQDGGGKLKFDWTLRPGASVEDIRLACEGAEKIGLDEEGNLLFTTAHGAIMDRRPIAYQRRAAFDGRSLAFIRSNPTQKAEDESALPCPKVMTKACL